MPLNLLVDAPVLATAAVNALNGVFLYTQPLEAAKVYFTKLPLNVAPTLVICKACGLSSLCIAYLLLSCYAKGGKPNKPLMLSGILAWSSMLAFMGYINYVDTSIMDASSMDKTPAAAWMVVMTLFTGAFVAGKDKAGLSSSPPAVNPIGVALFKIGTAIGVVNWLLMFVNTSLAISVYFNSAPSASEQPYLTAMFKFFGMACLQLAAVTYSFVHAGAAPSSQNLLAFAAGYAGFALDLTNHVFGDTTLMNTANIDPAGLKAWIVINSVLAGAAVYAALGHPKSSATTPPKKKIK